MGKIKIMAKYRLVGETSKLFFAFSLGLLITVILGNFSFLAFEAMRAAGVSFSDYVTENAVYALLSAAGIIIFLTVYAPLRLGTERWFLFVGKGEKAPVTELFYYFLPRRIIVSIRAVLFCAVKKTAAFLLFVFPSACLFGVLYFSLGEGEISAYVSYAVFAFAAVLFLSGLVFYFIYSARYFAYYSVYVSNETIKPNEAFEKSMEITHGAYGRISFFRISFLPWFLLCLPVLPAFYVWGYYKEAKAMLCLRNDALHS